MATANIHARNSIAKVYSPGDFARDVAQNARTETEFRRGVRIASAPDEAGDFDIEPTWQEVGESPGAIFLAPFRHGAYEDFLDDIIEACRDGFRAEVSPGPGDRRIRGARQ